ncbi:hypothetical protein [Ulvibacterium marinum]|uniref:hypothetical protein n=1 Tax=Ulvibacterium marinum TaxID=2419782 RepID=UPI0024949A1A|nr:hypothetical protein [Ulvibacterium marinum]
MKKIVTVFAIALGCFTINAQEFTATERYIVMNERSNEQKEENGPALIDLVATDDPSDPIATLRIAEQELLEEVHITSLRAPGLEGIAEILKVELAYSACCISTDTYYFLVSEDNDFISLPRLENVYCEGSEADTHYIFPSQAYGQEGTILQAKKHYTTTYEVKDIEVTQSFVWNDDDFDQEEAISAIK